MSRDVFEAIPEIGERLSQAAYRLICLDLNGSLEQQFCYPEVDSPWSRLNSLLSSLVERPGTSVAVISSKDRGELHDCLAINGMIYLGNQGLEISGPGQLFVEPTATEKSADLASLADLLSAKLADTPEAHVENKGLTLRVQYDKVASENVEALRRVVHNVLAGSDHPFQLTSGEGFFDIRPRVDWDKGAAVALVKERIGQPDPLVVYLGESLPSQDSLAGIPDAVTVQIGHGPDSGAQFQIEDPERLVDFLSWLDGFLQEQEHGLKDERQLHSVV